MVIAGTAWLLWPGPWGCGSGFDRDKFALVGAAKITNTAYHVRESGDYSASSCRASLGSLDKSRKVRVRLQPKGYDARKSSLYGNVEYELRLDGSIVSPRIERTYLSSVISNPATYGETSAKAVQATLEAQPATTYELVVGFRKGIPWGDYAEFVKGNAADGKLNAADVVFFSPFKAPSRGAGLLRSRVEPIGWDWSPEIRRLMGRAGDPDGNQLEEFRYWVSRLDRDADLMLRHFGLSLADLRQRANQGLVYGYVDVASGKDQIEMLNSPMIAWVRIVNADPSGK
ncbi:hypothetical protein [Nonomuraea sp. NPDC001831]|uniref:hypothetical protein n=1 Tax=Nonomuraea sp. NPDC001831 TaxID=3364340 RepID=UPI00367F9C60